VQVRVQVKRGRANKKSIGDKFTKNNGDEVSRPNKLLPNPKPELVLSLTSLMQFGMVDSATIVPNSLVTVHVLGRQQNEEKTEIEISHCDRKWYY
jgi:hypothetical protein